MILDDNSRIKSDNRMTVYLGEGFNTQSQGKRVLSDRPVTRNDLNNKLFVVIPLKRHY